MGIHERRQREREKRRATILQAAGQLFQEKGFSATTIDEIAVLAEVGKGTVYNYFPSKQEIIGALLLQNLTQALQWFDETIDEFNSSGDTDPMNRLNALAGTFLRFIMQQIKPSNSAYILMGDFNASDMSEELKNELRTAVQRIIDHVSRILQAGAELGLFRSDLQPEQMALIVWGAAIGVQALSARLSPSILPDFTEDAFDGFLKLIPGGLK